MSKSNKRLYLSNHNYNNIAFCLNNVFNNLLLSILALISDKSSEAEADNNQDEYSKIKSESTD
jgi:hypothetical protein